MIGDVLGGAFAAEKDAEGVVSSGDDGALFEDVDDSDMLLGLRPWPFSIAIGSARGEVIVDGSGWLAVEVWKELGKKNSILSPLYKATQGLNGSRGLSLNLYVQTPQKRSRGLATRKYCGGIQSGRNILNTGRQPYLISTKRKIHVFFLAGHLPGGARNH
jgi:hypothetical protein